MRGHLNAAWIAILLLNGAAIVIWPSWQTVPFHLISIGLTLLFWLRIWPADPVLWGLGIVLITTSTGIVLDLLDGAGAMAETLETPLYAAMLFVIVGHANRRIAADRELRIVSAENARLLAAQRRFLQDASHHLRTPVTIALTHAELLARDLTGQQERRDAQIVIAEMIRLRRLSERLFLIAASEDPEFLRAGHVALDEFAAEVVERWRPTAPRRWRLGRLDAATVRADEERLGLAVDALIENAVRHTSADDVIELSVISDGPGQARVVVRDTGSGISPGDLGWIFDRFRTGAGGTGTRNGTGLGLSVVQAVASAHGGSAAVRSAVGTGTEFEIALPAGGGDPAAPGSAARAKPI